MQRCKGLEIKEKLKLAFTSNGKPKLLILVVAFIGIALIMLSEFIPTSNKQVENKSNYLEYVSSVEEKTQEIIASIYGVGKCKVMITISNSSESIYAKDNENSSNNGSYSNKNEYVFYDGENGDTPVLIKENMPSVQGVVVVCEGAYDASVREQITSAISALFNISSTKISISKLG